MMTAHLNRLGQALVLAASVLLMQSCITDITAMRAEINDLKQDSYQTKKDIAEIKKRQGALKENVGTLKERPVGVAGDDALAALRASQADLYSQVSDTLKEMQELSGRVDEQHHGTSKQLDQLAAEVDLIKAKLDKGPAAPAGAEAPQDIRDRLSRIEADIVFLKAKLSALGATDVGKPAAPTAATPETDYKQAYALFKDAKFDEGRAAFEEFLDTYPNNQLAGNAQFWIGECFYQQKQYENAILAYEEVIKNFATNRKVPAAMLKQGFAFANLGDKEAARGILSDVMAKYPNTDLARAAKKKLDTIK